MHYSYKKPYGLSHDIALLKLSSPAQLNSAVGIACLPDTSVDLPIDDESKKCWITGIQYQGVSIKFSTRFMQFYNGRQELNWGARGIRKYTLDANRMEQVLQCRKAAFSKCLHYFCGHCSFNTGYLEPCFIRTMNVQCLYLDLMYNFNRFDDRFRTKIAKNLTVKYEDCTSKKQHKALSNCSKCPNWRFHVMPFPEF